MITRLKNILGIEGVKVAIDAPETLHLGLRQVDFTLLFSTQSVQKIESVNVRLIERYRRGWGNSKLINEYVLYEEEEPLDLMIFPEEDFKVPLSIEFDYSKSRIESLGENILLKPISKLAILTKRAKSSFRLEVSARIRGVKMNPLTIHQFEKGIK